MVHPASLRTSLGRLTFHFHIYEPLHTSRLLMKIDGLIKHLSEIMSELVSFCFVFFWLQLLTRKNLNVVQLRPNYYRTILFSFFFLIIGQFCVSVNVFKKWAVAFPGGKSAGWQLKEIDFCLLWIKQLTSYVKAIVEMWCHFVRNVVSK